MNKIFVTGRPGVGKTTLIFKVSNELKARGLNVGGIVTLEVRSGGVRVGFKIVDIQSGAEARLASVSSAVGPRVGKYLVHVENLDAFAVTSILRALEQCDLVVVDEIGPMELKSQKFIDAVRKALASEKPLLATLRLCCKPPSSRSRSAFCLCLDIGEASERLRALACIVPLHSQGTFDSSRRATSRPA